MRAGRVVLLVSPLLLLLDPIPNLVMDPFAVGPFGLGIFLLLRFVPWNGVIAILCFAHARTHGRSMYLWSVLGLLAAPVAPLILACLPDKAGSASAELRSAGPVKMYARPAAGIMEDRFPLLVRVLTGRKPKYRDEQLARYNRVKANYEFSIWPMPEATDRLLQQAAERKFTICGHKEEDWLHVYGAGLVGPDELAGTLDWLKEIAAPGKKLSVAVRDTEGILKMQEYYPGHAMGAGA